ncbi:hypothetical protein [Komagataeibacter xylinus]|uniref:hypothetical protein n=1 Tax=Komagataeibacter xylinus TaxID=28448 RepID=UPI00132FD8BE|nr:hypothetical protein [Komagataeibacter xylinus]
MTGFAVPRPLRPTGTASLAMVTAACLPRPGRRATAADRPPGRMACSRMTIRVVA